MKRFEQTLFSFASGPPAPSQGRPAFATAPAMARAAALPERAARRRPTDRAPLRALAGIAPSRPLLPGVESDEFARHRLERRIDAYLDGGRLALAITDNRHTMISVRRDKGLFRLRVHRMFLEAEEDVVRALARYVNKNDKVASQLLGKFIDLNQHRIRRTRRAETHPVTIETSGEIFDLQSLYDDLNRRYFDGVIQARITWGQRAPKDAKKRRHNSIKMGSYSVEDKLIRIHPSLDRPFVPLHFLEWIVYHEMLHQRHAIPIVGGRRQFHTPEFLRDESTFEHYDISRRWERENLNRLLVY